METESAIARLAFLVAPGNLDGLSEYIKEVVPGVIKPETAYEIVLQSYLFFGYPQAIESLRIFSTTAAELKLNWESEDGAVPREVIRRRGEKLCREIYHPNFEQLIDNMQKISAELTEWMVTEGYGRVLSRPGPAKLQREIASIVFLCCSGHPVQLFSHVRGARNLGATTDLLLGALEKSGLDERQIGLARSTIERVFTA